MLSPLAIVIAVTLAAPPVAGQDQRLLHAVMKRAPAAARAVASKAVARARAAAPPRVGRAPLEFPADHGVHPGYVAEWWYFNGNLHGAGGESFGYQLCFFKTAAGIDLVHAAITDVQGQRHPHVRVTKRSGVSAAAERLDVAFGSQYRVRPGEGSTLLLTLAVPGCAANLELRPTRGALMVNGDGVIDMPEGTSSRYYSVPRIATSGTLTIEGRTVPVTGRSWFDHQWGNFIAAFRPWDWFSFQMADGSSYNIFSFRPATGFKGRACATVARADGSLVVTRQVRLSPRNWWESPRGGRYALSWTVELPELGETFRTESRVPDQEMPRAGLTDPAPTYWEGALTVTRSGPSGSTPGEGYSEHMPHRTSGKPGA